jgi:hypothetical protein
VTPVMAALYNGHWILVEELLAKYQISLDSINSFDNWTILHIIASSDPYTNFKISILEKAKDFINYQ